MVFLIPTKFSGFNPVPDKFLSPRLLLQTIFSLSLICNNCGITLPDGAKFCFNCGAKQLTDVPPTYTERPTTLKYELDLNGNVVEQISELFITALHTRLIEEHQPSRQAEYMEELYRSGFRETVQLRAQQLAEEAVRLEQTDLNGPLKVSRMLDTAYNDLLDYFIIHYCQHLNAIELPEAILKYQYVARENLNLFQMVFDYLDFTNEKETVYTDFLSMPLDKLRNAGKSFLKPQKDERILFICDQTLFGSVKEGFALTEAAIYWKAQFQKAQAVRYRDLQTVERQKDWLHINGHFFNVNPSLNLKMMKLLKKLRGLY